LLEAECLVHQSTITILPPQYLLDHERRSATSPSLPHNISFEIPLSPLEIKLSLIRLVILFLARPHKHTTPTQHFPVVKFHKTLHPSIRTGFLLE
jgi:hypothetical protein